MKLYPAIKLLAIYEELQHGQGAPVLDVTKAVETSEALRALRASG